MPPVSKIAQLPEDVRAWLHSAIVGRAFGDIVGLTEELNAMLREAGIATYVGKSAVGAESLKVKRAQEAIKATTEATRLIAETSRDDGDTRSEATIALIQSDVFELLLQVREAEDEVDPIDRLKVLTKVAQSMSEMSRARVNQAKWRAEVDARVRAAAEKVDKLVRKGGLSKDTADEIRANILGIGRQAATQASA